MPYVSRKKYRSRRRTRRPVGKKFVKRVQKITRKVLQSNLEVKRYMMSAVEQKVDTLVPGATTNWLQPIVNIAQGTHSYDRVGSKIKVIGLQFKNFFHNNTTVPIWIRMVLLRVPAGTTMGPSSTLFMNTLNSEANFTAVNGMNSMMKPIHPAFGKVMFNKVIKIIPSVATGESSGFIRYNRFFKFPRGINVQFNESGVTAGNLNTQLVFGVWAAEAPEDTTTGSTIEWTYECNCFFTDA